MTTTAYNFRFGSSIFSCRDIRVPRVARVHTLRHDLRSHDLFRLLIVGGEN